jgi:hypothetical protein
MAPFEFPDLSLVKFQTKVPMNNMSELTRGCKMTFSSLRLFIASFMIGSSVVVLAQEKNALHETFNRVGKIIESSGCPKDFVKPVGEVITKVCGEAKEGIDIEPVKFLKDNSEDAPEIFCSYEDGVYELMVGDTSDQPTASQVKITMTDTGQVTEITKDELKVEGSVCKDLATRLDKGGRIPASVDTELCFDYYPAPKFMASQAPNSCKKSAKK